MWYSSGQYSCYDNVPKCRTPQPSPPYLNVNILFGDIGAEALVDTLVAGDTATRLGHVLATLLFGVGCLVPIRVVVDTAALQLCRHGERRWLEIVSKDGEEYRIRDHTVVADYR